MKHAHLPSSSLALNLHLTPGNLGRCKKSGVVATYMWVFNRTIRYFHSHPERGMVQFMGSVAHPKAHLSAFIKQARLDSEPFQTNLLDT